ncbi:prephenate dehydratase [Rummeliibacillus suwonensis]|uniref:prephenate dehydratase n=1 Tax=Rummeliibacillus suwonensis TaxID=1306154 RepID=UPI001AAFAB3A|nr:prephenate dehydratase [Rummeliibacillus suwonensis]MBO2534829.1 prephenate dehydratase [Rummeliibacillus suwonensis]
MVSEEWKNRVAYLGPKGTFTHLAAQELFPNEWMIPFRTIPECIEAVAESQVELAIVPLENALEGIVPLTIDYLYHEVNLYVVGEVLSPIEQHLMVHKKQVANWKNIQGVYSHPHALAQCHKYLYYRFRGVPLHQTSSTAAAAKFVFEHSEECIAAIGNSAAAETYDLEIVQPKIHDFHFNHTRFVVLSRSNGRIELAEREEQIKTTLMIKLSNDHSGALHQILSVFAWRKINLSKIESRPLKTGLGDYFFILDLLEDENAPLMKGAMEELAALGCTVKSLGSYYTYKQHSKKASK